MIFAMTKTTTPTPTTKSAKRHCASKEAVRTKGMAMRCIAIMALLFAMCNAFVSTKAIGTKHDHAAPQQQRKKSFRQRMEQSAFQAIIKANRFAGRFQKQNSTHKAAKPATIDPADKKDMSTWLRSSLGKHKKRMKRLAQKQAVGNRPLLGNAQAAK